GPSRRQDADRGGGIVGDEPLGDDERERRIPDERERLLIEGGRMLIGPRRMRERPLQQLGVSKGVPQPREPCESGVTHVDARALRERVVDPWAKRSGLARRVQMLGSFSMTTEAYSCTPQGGIEKLTTQMGPYRPSA
ncbi:MAG TPA: hypothetical protein VEA38_07365, partial [Terriglobales bacterium]|nr:hypothetical protein [Terriglobales bacterium]